MPVKLYTHHAMPTVWIGIDTTDDSAWIVWGTPNGWSQRKPFLGSRTYLEPALPHAGLCIDLPR